MLERKRNSIHLTIHLYAALFFFYTKQKEKQVIVVNQKYIPPALIIAKFQCWPGSLALFYYQKSSEKYSI